MYHSSADYHKGISEEHHQDEHFDDSALGGEEGLGTKPEQLDCCVNSKEKQEHHLQKDMNLGIKGRGEEGREENTITCMYVGLRESCTYVSDNPYILISWCSSLKYTTWK